MTIDIEKIKPSLVNMKTRAKLDFSAGDTIRVWQRIKEGDKSRLQAFEGMVIARKHGREPGATFTVRKVSSGVGVERIFPLYLPTIEKIEILIRSKVRRSKLYYIREKATREIKKKIKQLKRVDEVLMEKEKVKEVKKDAEKDEKTPTDKKPEKVEAKEQKVENKKEEKK